MLEELVKIIAQYFQPLSSLGCVVPGPFHRISASGNGLLKIVYVARCPKPRPKVSAQIPSEGSASGVV